jgi:hypothetical protein
MRQIEAKTNQKLDRLTAEARAIKYALIHGALSYSEAKKRIEPLLEEVNKVGKQIAKKYKVKYKEIRIQDLG